LDPKEDNARTFSPMETQHNERVFIVQMKWLWYLCLCLFATAECFLST